MTPNRLVIRLQPDEGVRLYLLAKEPGPGGIRLRPVSLDLSFAEEWLNASIEKKVLPKLGLRRNPPAVLYTDHSGAPMEHLVRLKQPYLRHELVSRVREMLGQTREERLLSAFSLKQLKKSDLSRRKEGDSPQPCERPSP